MVETIFGLLFTVGFIYLFYIGIKSNLNCHIAQKQGAKASLNPDDYNVSELIRIFKKHWFTKSQPPEVFNSFRQTFMLINESPNVSTELKIQLREALINKHVALPTHKIIDNYKHYESNDNEDFEQDKYYKKK